MTRDDAGDRGGPPYTMFQLAGTDVAGGMEMSPMVPADVPSNWMVYFGVDDIDASYSTALEAGGREMLPPQDIPQRAVRHRR